MNAEDPKYQAGEPLPLESLPSDVIISSDTRRENRIPPGQSRTRKWPILDAHGTPQIDRASWKLDVFGLVDQPYSLSLAEFQTLPRVKVYADFHCVTRWSRLGNMWEGVSTRTLLERAGVKPEARYVVCHAYDRGWTTNLPLADFLSNDALLADLHDGQPISADHGGPVRGMVPLLYAWKSAKWIRGIELSAYDKPGYWERGGYHNHGDPWTEERFSGWFS
ncbi:oxidoreductase molybdopterin binding protein [Pirellula staleyi DSM 6068]|uniref:Oxidoreductase molybdopterin binding protein n=1 Tax=Pirellula staleyi (strain ATCC 27377 / DSM 6068 / ICPB 4128) TaxID=530564 RepID=D2R3H1_PIRSD|nr:sulfite oxidase-like oxidoreductase [Pirellula staleyi]ADB15202.1 oxidoreductase molybdopterin binding protein [Pirellula staleyi DSM 6068]